MNLTKRKKKLQKKKDILSILKKTNIDILKINEERSKYNKETAEYSILNAEINELKRKNREKIQKDKEFYNELVYSKIIKDKNIFAESGSIYDYEVLVKFEKELTLEEDKIFQQELLKQDLEYKKELNKDNKLMKKFTFVLALGIILEIYNYIFETLQKFTFSDISIMGIYIISLVIFLLFLYETLDVLELREKLFEKHKNWKITTIIIISAIMILLGGTILKDFKFKKEPLTENQIYNELKLEQEKTNNLILNLTESNNKIINLEKCLTNLEENKSFEICLK
jgi:uncharacterized membrane protein